MKSVLVTGGAGYIGSHTTQKLLAAGYKVVVVDNLTTGFQDAVPAGAEFVKGDVRATELVVDIMKKYKVDSVIHFAAKLVVPESIEKPVEYHDNNVGGMISILNACQLAGISKFVFSSTAAVYGEPANHDLISESAIPKPLNPYGATKLESEGLLKKARTIQSVILRYFNVAGAARDGSNGQRTKGATHLIKVACEAACGKRPMVSIFGTDYPTKDGSGVRDFIFIEDLADLHVLALAYLEKGGLTDTFNCGYGQGTSVREVLKTVQTVSQKEFVIEEKPRRPGDSAQVVADPTKIKERFQWQPRHNDLELICRTSYEWESKI